MEAFDIIILAMVAGFIFLRLRSELGNKSGNEPLPPARGYDRDSNPVINGEAQEVGEDGEPGARVVPMEGDPLLRAAYADIRRLDRSFEAGTFLQGASTAYTMILEAFWGGDRETLKNFLSDDVYNQFDAAVTAREEAGQTLENRILDMESAKVTAARVVGKVAELTVHFTTEMVSVTRDSDGKPIEGNISDTITVNDKWTFSRDLKSRNPSWTLVATRAG